MPRTRTCTPRGEGGDRVPRNIAEIIERLTDKKLCMIGVWNPKKYLSDHFTSTPPDATIGQWQRIFQEAARTTQLAILKVSGNDIPRNCHDRFLHLLAFWLPKLHIIALNVGEMDASPAAYDALERALEHPDCIVAHLYWKDPIRTNAADVDQKERVKDLLTMNRFKLRYCQQLVREEVYALHGANCWVNFEDRHLVRARSRLSRESNAGSQCEKDALALRDVANGEEAILKKAVKAVLAKLVNTLERMEKKETKKRTR